MTNKEYIINWDAVQTVDDIKRILKTINISFDYPSNDIDGIIDLVQLQEKQFNGHPFPSGSIN